MSERPPVTGDPILDQFVKLDETNLIPDDISVGNKIYKAYKLWWKYADLPEDKEYARQLKILAKSQQSALSLILQIKAASQALDRALQEAKRMMSAIERKRDAIDRNMKAFAAGFTRQIEESKESIKAPKSVNHVSALIKRLQVLKALKERNCSVDDMLSDITGQGFDERLEQARITWQRIASQKIRKVRPPAEEHHLPKVQEV